MNENDKFWSFPVSLNINVRKNKSEEIFKENKKIAESLSKCKGSSEYSVKKLLAQADENNRLKNMITKKRKLAAIKKQMESVRGGPVRNIKFTDVVNDALSKLKKAATLATKLDSTDLKLENVLEWLINDISIDKKIVDFLLDIYTIANVLDGAISTDKVVETIDKTQYALELMNM